VPRGAGCGVPRGDPLVVDPPRGNPRVGWAREEEQSFGGAPTPTSRRSVSGLNGWDGAPRKAGAPYGTNLPGCGGVPLSVWRGKVVSGF
jgi:hypothetical protein